MRYRENTPEELARLDFGVVLRAVLLFAVDRHRARQVTGILAEEWRL